MSPSSTAAAKVRPCVHVATDSRRDGRGVRVREIHLAALVDPVEQARAPRRVQRIPADVRDLERAALVARQPRAAPATAPSPLTSGASSLPSNSHCMPRQMPSSGVPRPAACRMAAVHAPSSAAVAPKCPTPGTTMPSRRRELGGVGGREQVRARGREALADRREVAGAVVDERDHSSPFVLGSIRAMRGSRAHATRSARANALNTASTW